MIEGENEKAHEQAIQYQEIPDVLYDNCIDSSDNAIDRRISHGAEKQGRVE